MMLDGCDTLYVSYFCIQYSCVHLYVGNHLINDVRFLAGIARRDVSTVLLLLIKANSAVLCVKKSKSHLHSCLTVCQRGLLSTGAFHRDQGLAQ